VSSCVYIYVNTCRYIDNGFEGFYTLKGWLVHFEGLYTNVRVCFSFKYICMYVRISMCMYVCMFVCIPTGDTNRYIKHAHIIDVHL